MLSLPDNADCAMITSDTSRRYFTGMKSSAGIILIFRDCAYLLIDFNRVGDEVKDLFLHYLNDLDTLFMYLSGYYNVKLYEHESLIIFDEVQMFPRARAAIKYLVADGRYDYLSLIHI